MPEKQNVPFFLSMPEKQNVPFFLPFFLRPSVLSFGCTESMKAAHRIFFRTPGRRDRNLSKRLFFAAHRLRAALAKTFLPGRQ